MPKRKHITELCAERYGDEKVSQAVIEDAVTYGTVKRIEDGELALPSEQDAVHWHRRKLGLAADESQREKDMARIVELEKTVASLVAAFPVPQQGFMDELKKRTESLRKGGA